MSYSTLASSNIPALALSAHGLVLAGLGALVTIKRVQTKNVDKDGSLNKVVRAHGNAAEWIPYLTVTFLYYAVKGGNDSTVDALIIGSTVARLANAAGILLSGKDFDSINVLRPVGALSTYATVAGLAIKIALDTLNKPGVRRL